MDLESTRKLVYDRAFDILGLTATITAPYASPVASRAIWMRNLFEDQPVGRDYARLGPRRLMAIRRNGFSEIPRGTIVAVVEKLGAAATNWQVDGIEEVTRGHFVVVVVPETNV